jgi:serine/threonine protein phosphatase 1
MIFGKGIDFDRAKGPDGMRIYAIGDVHGRFDCLRALHEMIADEIARDRPADWRIIHLGDYVDRGPQSREVLEFLSNACARDERIIATLGNHDEGFLDFLRSPGEAQLFIDYGGFDTCASYGVVLRTMKREELIASHRETVDAVPRSHILFLRDRPRSASFGDFYFCHAGIRPEIALDSQDGHDLIWIRRDFLDHRRLYAKVIVHGHTPCAQPEVLANRVNVDTKAFETGRLTALVIDGNLKRFIETRL